MQRGHGGMWRPCLCFTYEKEEPHWTPGCQALPNRKAREVVHNNPQRQQTNEDVLGVNTDACAPNFSDAERGEADGRLDIVEVCVEVNEVITREALPVLSTSK
jgi:hypothetical protein